MWLHVEVDWSVDYPPRWLIKGDQPISVLPKHVPVWGLINQGDSIFTTTHSFLDIRIHDMYSPNCGPNQWINQSFSDPNSVNSQADRSELSTWQETSKQLTWTCTRHIEDEGEIIDFSKYWDTNIANNDVYIIYIYNIFGKQYVSSSAFNLIPLSPGGLPPSAGASSAGRWSHGGRAGPGGARGGAGAGSRAHGGGLPKIGTELAETLGFSAYWGF